MILTLNSHSNHHRSVTHNGKPSASVRTPLRDFNIFCVSRFVNSTRLIDSVQQHVCVCVHVGQHREPVGSTCTSVSAIIWIPSPGTARN